MFFFSLLLGLDLNDGFVLFCFVFFCLFVGFFLLLLFFCFFFFFVALTWFRPEGFFFSLLNDLDLKDVFFFLYFV